MEKTFFMRFYGEGSEDRARQMLAAVEAAGYKVEHSIGPLDMSVNMMRMKESCQLNLEFDTPGRRAHFLTNSRLKNQYQQLATQVPGIAEVVVRNPGDTAFGH